MEETLGRRISTNRKRLGLTQDQLAEQLGVTAQAVSKWENDQSCPDIQTLPRLAAIFGITTDELLGAEPVKKKVSVREGEALDGGSVSPEKDRNLHIKMTGGRRFTLGLALWLLLSGFLLMFYSEGRLETWSVFLAAGLIIFGLMGTCPRFSVYRLSCAVLGAAALVPGMQENYLKWPTLLIILGGLLLLDSLLVKREKTETLPAMGTITSGSGCDMTEDRFSCRASFGEKYYRIDLPRLCGGTSSLAFGSLKLDLTGCGSFEEKCLLECTNSFGETKLLLPRSCVVKPNVKTAFGEFRIQGQPDPGAEAEVILTGSVSFGEMTVTYC